MNDILDKMKKSLYIILIFVLILGSFSNVFAAELKTKLDIIQQSSETKYLENDQGYITKSIVNSDPETGEATIEMSLSNISKNTSDEEKYDNTEIYIIVSENLVNDTEKLNTYISYIDTLTTNIFAKNSNTKIGIIGIKGTIADGELDENGNMVWSEDDEGDVLGTADNAEIVVNLTDNPEQIKNGLQGMNSSKNSYRTNLQATIRLANNSYSNNVNKLAILLYDDVPIIAIGVESLISYGGLFSEYSTVEEAVIAKHEKIASKTKSEILTLKSNNVDFILLRPDDTSYDETWYSVSTGEVILEFDGSPYVQEIYGTLENPTYGKMYSLNNDTLDKVVTEYIYQDVIKNIRVDIKSAEIKEYFSDEILENFDITFDDENIDTTNLLTDKYITWDIGDLAGNETASLKYTLKIKDMKNTELLNKVLATNEKTEMTYINYLDTETTISSTSSPKIQLSEVKEELTATVSYDPTSETTGKVTATIKTNKKVNAVEGWTISEDGMTLTKEYSSNTTETVHLVDIDGMTKDVVITISNIKVEETPKAEEPPKKDTTTSTGKLPQTGVRIEIIISAIVLVGVGIFAYFKYRNLKNI